MSLQEHLELAATRPDLAICPDDLLDADLDLFLTHLPYYAPGRQPLQTQRVVQAMRKIRWRRWATLLAAYHDEYFVPIKGDSPMARFWRIVEQLPNDFVSQVIGAIKMPIPRLAQQQHDWAFLAEIELAQPLCYESAALLTHNQERYFDFIRRLPEDVGMVILRITRLRGPQTRGKEHYGRIYDADICWALSER